MTVVKGVRTAEFKMKQKLTILHSNDIHGDFLERDENGKKAGGIARLSGYVNSVRLEDDNAIYLVAGDMFRGSIIDSEYAGTSTIQLMNLLYPDVACIGNHEIDYGVSHALFVEKCANFPIINSNLYITTNFNSLLPTHHIMEVGGLKILFISVVTKDLVNQTQNDPISSFYVEADDYLEAIEYTLALFKEDDINAVILLTHIGFEEDKKLAESIKPEWGINLIVGGHSHTFIDEPAYVNGIPIVTAGTGIVGVGRADMVIDTQTGKTESFKWQMVPINEDTCEEEPAILNLLDYFKTDVDHKYETVLNVMKRKLTHPRREQETEIGNLFTDLLLDNYNLDIATIASGSIRKPEFGPTVTLRTFREIFPFTDDYMVLNVSGAQLRRMIAYVLREESIGVGEHSEFYQFSRGCRFVWSREKQKFDEFKFNGKDIEDDQLFRYGIQEYHYNNFEKFFGVPFDEIEKNGKPRLMFSGINAVMEELLSSSKNLDSNIEGRVVYY